MASFTLQMSATAEVDGERRTMTAGFLWACSGYYDYDAGYTPHFEGQERFGGHPCRDIGGCRDDDEFRDHALPRVLCLGEEPAGPDVAGHGLGGR